MQCPVCNHAAPVAEFGDPLRCSECGAYYEKAVQAKAQAQAQSVPRALAISGAQAAVSNRASYWWLAIFLPIGGAIIFLGYGAYIGSTPEGKDRASARRAIDMCREQERSYIGSIGALDIISGACRKLENDFRVRFGRNP